MSNKQTVNFEKNIDLLNQIVEKMEQGGLSIEDSLKYFEEGIALTRNCQKALKNAEQKVQILLEKHGQPNLEPYNED